MTGLVHQIEVLTRIKRLDGDLEARVAQIWNVLCDSKSATCTFNRYRRERKDSNRRGVQLPHLYLRAGHTRLPTAQIRTNAGRIHRPASAGWRICCATSATVA